MTDSSESDQTPWPRGQQPPWKIWAIANRCPSSSNHFQTTALLSRTSAALQPGDTVLEAIVLYDFKSASKDEITVFSNDGVLIIKSTDWNWWYILHQEKKGYVPASYLEVIGTMIWPGPSPPNSISHYPQMTRRGISLLSLPYELRCIIYEYTFLNNVIPFGPVPSLNIALPFTSKQLYTESLPYYYNLSSFDGRTLKICMQWYLTLSKATRTFIDHMRIRLRSLTDSDPRQDLFRATYNVLEMEGCPVKEVILNVVLTSSPINPKILPRRVRKRESTFPPSRWTLCSSPASEWTRCKKSTAKMKNGRLMHVVCDRTCCMPIWMIEATEVVELCLRQRGENRRFRELKGKVIGELMSVGTKNGDDGA